MKAPGHRRTPAPRIALSAAFMVCVVVAGAVWAGYRVLGADLVAVPDLVGLSEQQAEAALADAGLRLHVGALTVDAVGPPGRVLDQRPAPGERIAPGDTVSVTLSMAPQRVTLPDLRGTDFEIARDALVALGLRVEVERADSEATGTVVVGMSLAPGSAVVPGSDVTLLIPDPAPDGGLLLPSDLTGITLLLDVSPRTESADGDPALDVARRLRGLLEASGAVVVSTRTTTGAVPSLEERARFVAATPAAVLIVLDIVPDADGATAAITYTDAVGARVRSLALGEALARSLRDAELAVEAPVPATDAVFEAFDGPGVRCRLSEGALLVADGGASDPLRSDALARAIYRGLASIIAAWE